MRPTEADERNWPARREQNRRSWNAVTAAHNAHKRDQVGFFRRGGSTLFPEELALLGEVAGKRVVHLQCNCGQDTLSLARLGASVTGVDLADGPIAFARHLAAQTGLAGEFIQSDLYEWFEQTDARFEVAFTSYGAIGWLHDAHRWARGVARVLAPGGRLVVVEFHPLLWSLGAQGSLTGDSYFLGGEIRSDQGVHDYVGEALAPSGFEAAEQPFQNSEPSFSYQWTLAETVQVILDAGLRLEQLHEYPYTNGLPAFEGMQELPGRRYAMPVGTPSLPLMFGLVARR